MSRRSRRFERRQEKRAKKKEKLKECDNFERFSSLTSLYMAARKAASGVSWKASVQRYSINILFKIYEAQKDLQKLKDMRKGFIEFDLKERGKLRHIKSVHFSERVIQKSLCSNALYPVLTNDLIYDNSSSQKGKGTKFATDRVEKFLHKYFKNYGNEGFALVIDYKSYFENILHQPLKERFREKFSDENIIKYADDFVDAFGERGLGLGSETSQINAIAYTNKIDYAIKEKHRCKYYQRYMDDCVIIHQSKETLRQILKDLEDIHSELGITLNQKKTAIVRLKHGFTFLKTRFKLTPTGRVVKRPCRKSIVAERRKLKRQAKLLEKGVLTLNAIEIGYNSWKGSMKYRDARKSVYYMDKLYKKLFEKYKDDKEKNHDKTIKDKRICDGEKASEIMRNGKSNRAIRKRTKRKYQHK